MEDELQEKTCHQLPWGEANVTAMDDLILDHAKVTTWGEVSSFSAQQDDRFFSIEIAYSSLNLKVEG